MSKIDELDKIYRAIKNSEISLKAIQDNIEVISKEIESLSPRQKELEKNIEFHKKSGTVPLAHEYKKAKTELSKIKARLILINFDQKKSIEACQTIETVIEKLKREHMELEKTGENNVLRVLFGGFRGKK